MKKVWMAAGLLGLTAGVTGTLWAQQRPTSSKTWPLLSNDPKIFAGLRGVHVLVESPGVRGEAIGLDKSTITTSVEIALKRNGIRVLSFDELVDAPGHPTLYINTNVAGPAFNISVDLQETVTLERKPTIRVSGATIWEQDTIGTHGGKAEYVMQTIEEMVNNFAIEYRKTNPKR